MRVRLLLVVMLVAGGLVFVTPGRALACSCDAPQPFGKAVKEADAVFAGVVTSLEQTSGQRSFLGSAPYGYFAYTFEVDEVVAGDVGSTVEVRAHSSGASCGIKFREEARYIVFGYDGRRGLEASLCSRTERINETVTFGGETPVRDPQVGPPIVDGNETRSTVLIVAAVLIGLGALVVLAQRLLPRRR